MNKEIEILKAEADEGDAESMYLYACRLNKGDEQNKKEAFRYFKQSSELGNSDATLEYAWMLDNDELIQSSKEEISHYYQLSISQNNNNIKANFIVLINMIIEKIQSPTILITKLRSFEPILKSIKIIIKNQEQINEKSFTKFHKELLTLSGFVENLNNENWCINFLKSEKSIQNFVSEIDTNISNIFSILKQKFNLIFKIPTINIYDDMKQISDFLSKPQYLNDPSFQNRRIEISNFFKPTKNLLIQIVEKFGRKYMLSENDYKKTVILSQTENYEIFEGEKNLTNEKLKIFVLKKIENFELLFKILTEIDGIQKVEKFYGALVTESSTELAIYTRGEPFKSENICLTIYAFKIAQVMSHLHSKLIIHRDLNLSNIYVDNFDENDPTKVTPIVTNFVNSVFLTKSSFLGMPNFTPVSPFSAPELKHNFRYDEKADVFAFGGILYQFVTGKPPFDGLSYQKVQQLLIDNERPNFEDDISPDIKNLIRNCWHQKTKKHFFKSDDGYLPQICRYSFDQIIYEMPSKKIVFPSDFDKKELIEKFYEDYTFKNDQSAQILDLFESCISGIDCVAQFKFEFYNSRLVLIQNKKAFLDSISKKTLNETEMSHVENLKNDLDSLLNLIIKAQSNEIIDYIKKEINHFTKNLNDLMQKVEESMKILCCEKVEKYIEDEEDLIFDYNELKFYIYKEYVSEEKPAFDYSKYRECDRILDIYIKKQKIGNITKKKLYSTVKSLLSSYKDREIDRGYFYYEKDAENDGAESLVYKGVYMKTGQRVAIKMVKNDYLKNLKNLICLKREINYLVTINHEFMQKFIGFSVSDCISGKWCGLFLNTFLIEH